MEKEKKQFTISDYIIVIVGFLTMITLVVFWSTPAHAKTITVNDIKFDIDDTISQDYPYYYIEYLSSLGCYQCTFTDKPLNAYSDNGKYKLVNTTSDTIHFNRIKKIKNDKNSYSYSVDDFTGTGGQLPVSDNSGNYLQYVSQMVACNYNLYKSTYSGGKWSVSDEIFFLGPERPVAQVAVELTPVIRKQTGVILIVAVSCLALLIGSLVLLPKLRLFLG